MVILRKRPIRRIAHYFTYSHGDTARNKIKYACHAGLGPWLPSRAMVYTLKFRLPWCILLKPCLPLRVINPASCLSSNSVLTLFRLIFVSRASDPTIRYTFFGPAIALFQSKYFSSYYSPPHPSASQGNFYGQLLGYRSFTRPLFM